MGREYSKDSIIIQFLKTKTKTKEILETSENGRN